MEGGQNNQDKDLLNMNGFNIYLNEIEKDN